jgi:hypothetical protein
MTTILLLFLSHPQDSLDAEAVLDIEKLLYQ